MCPVRETFDPPAEGRIVGDPFDDPAMDAYDWERICQMAGVWSKDFEYPKFERIRMPASAAPPNEPLENWPMGPFVPKKRVVYVDVEAVAERYPHKCPRCGGPAYLGLFDVDCMRKDCT